MRTTNFDAIAASAPLNRQASVVRDGSGDLYDPALPDGTEHWKAPPLPEAVMPPDTVDLSGRKVGRCTVVRYHRPHPTQKSVGAQWLIRCVCGDYELMSGRAIKASKASNHVCRSCNAFVHALHQRQNERRGVRTAVADAARLDEIAKGEVA